MRGLRVSGRCFLRVSCFSVGALIWLIGCSRGSVQPLVRTDLIANQDEKNSSASPASVTMAGDVDVAAQSVEAFHSPHPTTTFPPVSGKTRSRPATLTDSALVRRAAAAAAAGNHRFAAELFRQAARQGDEQAQIALGDLYAEGRGVERSLAEAFSWYRRAAEQGHGAGMIRMARMYRLGLGVSRDISKAVSLLEKAIRHGESSAAVQLAQLYLYGNGIPANPPKAVELLQQAARDGDSQAAYLLGEAYRSGKTGSADPARAIEYFRLAADRGYGKAQYALGVLLNEGGEGVPKDQQAALVWLRRAAANGVLDAKNNLGVAYSDGNGVAIDLREAARWFREAADGGHALAQANLATAYRYGMGVEKNYVAAYKWYFIASQRFALENIAMKVASDYAMKTLAGRMSPAQIDKATRLASDWLQDHPTALAISE